MSTLSEKCFGFKRKNLTDTVYISSASVCFRVLLANPKELIEMQTKNDTTDPRSSVTFYEKYHSLNDVRFYFLSFYFLSF